MEKENSQLETRKYEIEKLTGKSKHIIKVENHPHIKIADKLKDTSSKSFVSTKAVKQYTK